MVRRTKFFIFNLTVMESRLLTSSDMESLLLISSFILGINIISADCESRYLICYFECSKCSANWESSSDMWSEIMVAQLGQFGWPTLVNDDVAHDLSESVLVNHSRRLSLPRICINLVPAAIRAYVLVETMLRSGSKGVQCIKIIPFTKPILGFILLLFFKQSKQT